jgi:leucyl-tRNA synthetase
LHVGHPKGYIATDIIARQKMMEGKAVLHPMGWDAFGLPAENYAIKNKVHPSIAVAKNIERFKDQLGKLGFTYDWEREVNTTDPNFYKWTQWIFVQLFNKGLAYESFEPINWCPSCKTGLANEDLEDGRCERCGSVVEKKPMRQWVLKITDYAERLLRDLDTKVLNTGDFLETLSNGEKSFIQMTGPGIIQPDKPFVERPAIAAIVQHWKDDSFIVLKWKKVDWHTLVTGGIEEGQSMEEAARAEILEETGYKNLRLVKRLDEQVHGTFFHVPKNENRLGHFFGFHFQLENDEHVKIDDNEHEKHEVQWVTREEVQAKLTASTQQYIWSRLMNEPVVLDTSKDLLDWPESIKESQRNWIGKSEGAEIDFSITGSADKITVFTTRIDTLFGASYVVLAPEHPLIHKLEDTISNLKEVKKYIEAAAKKTEIDRTAEGKEKTGVELKGLKAINPATGEEIPIWIADYVLGDYGTGAVMAVPMHDDRDFAFAKEYDLPIKQVIAPSYGVPRQNETLVKGVCGAIYDPETKKFAVLEWGENNNQKLHGLYGMYGGGSEGEESFEEAVRREVLEESGLYDFKLIEPLWFGRPHYFNAAKNIARDAEVCCFLMIINSRDQKELKHEDHETFGHGWHTAEELITNWTERNINQDFDHWIDFIKRAVVRLREHSYSFHDDFSAEAYTGEGFLCNSGKYDGLSSAEARQKIVKDLGGRAVVRYKLRDWVFSRQRYWGEPIPIIHCADCGAVAVPEKDLPVVLPEVEYYEPTGTGESPLAGIEEWVNTTCPKCGKAMAKDGFTPGGKQRYGCYPGGKFCYTTTDGMFSKSPVISLIAIARKINHSSVIEFSRAFNFYSFIKRFFNIN